MASAAMVIKLISVLLMELDLSKCIRKFNVPSLDKPSLHHGFLNGDIARFAIAADVADGSKVDICAAKSHIRNSLQP